MWYQANKHSQFDINMASSLTVRANQRELRMSCQRTCGMYSLGTFIPLDSQLSNLIGHGSSQKRNVHSLFGFPNKAGAVKKPSSLSVGAPEDNLNSTSPNTNVYILKNYIFTPWPRRVILSLPKHGTWGLKGDPLGIVMKPKMPQKSHAQRYRMGKLHFTLLYFYRYFTL